jgi:integrase
MASAWVYQDSHHVERQGAEAASWYVGWMNLAGKKRCKSCGPGIRGKDKAEKLRRKVEVELEGGQYREQLKKTWAAFRKEYEECVLAGKSVRTSEEALAALGHFERIVKPAKVATITTYTVADFIKARRQERGHKPGTTLSPATVNKDLRHLKAALNVAVDWGMLPHLPKFPMEREPKKLPTYVPPEHFFALYAACEHARLPRDQAYPAAEWWRGLFITAYMTGWRIGALLALKRAEVDLKDGTALSRHGDNKGKRDVAVVLAPIVLEHLRRLPGFGPCYFPWHYRKERLFIEFARIQEKAGVKPLGKERYGFHDLRRAFATMNADKLTADALQALMQHKDYQTTQRYINMARQMKPAAHNLFVPPLPAVERA